MNGLFDHVAATESLGDSLQPVWEAPDGAAALQEWAWHLARYHPRLIPLSRAMELVHRTDPDAGRHRERVVQAQRANCERLAGRLESEGRLSPPWTVESAGDMLWALVSTDIIERLMVELEWSMERFAKHFGALLRATFVLPLVALALVLAVPPTASAQVEVEVDLLAYGLTGFSLGQRDGYFVFPTVHLGWRF